MKKILFSIFLVLTFALLMGATCGPEEEIPETPPEDLTDQADTAVTQEPEVPETPPEPELEQADFMKAYFDFDKYNIRPDAQRALEHNAQLLKQNPDVDIVIEGHCDERGTVEYNLALGERRAQSVKSYLVKLGIDGDRMETVSFGKERPIDPGHNEEAWQKNRRADFRIED